MSVAIEHKEKWDRRYSKKVADKNARSIDFTHRFHPIAPQALLDNQQYLVAGTVLDVASGEGAVALHLAENENYSLTALDISPVGLQLLSTYAIERKLKIQAVTLDLDDSNSISRLGVFDNITIFRYKPTNIQFKDLVGLLSIGGRLIISTFNEGQHHLTGFPIKLCLSANELKGVDERLNLLKYDTSQTETCIDTYIFERFV